MTWVIPQVHSVRAVYSADRDPPAVPGTEKTTVRFEKGV
jgi:hypothetical protein